MGTSERPNDRSSFATDSARVEAFSDGVLAVIITIMVLGLKPPNGTSLESLRAVVPTVATYVLSFVFIGIYWNNHHHMLRAAKMIDGRAMWANLHLLFWLSLIPFTTNWLGQNPTAPIPTALYALVLLLDGLAYTVLQRTLVAVNGAATPFAKAVESDLKGTASLVIYVCAIAFAFLAPAISDILFVAVAAMWVVPDRRLERVMMERE